jgi:allantoate deiminase
MSEVLGRTTRRFLTPPVADVHTHLHARMTALGMSVTVDAAGNLRGLWQSTSAPRLILGSHIDTVPDAGAYDGVLGVVLALELVEQAQREALPLAIEVIAFSEEEGVRFGIPFIGSRAVAGRFDSALLSLRDAEGVSLDDALRNFGLDPAGLDDAIVSTEAVGFLEIHIEQGPVLEAENLSLALVTAIAGQTRLEVAFTGQANHAGTTPMHLRQDAVAAAAEWISIVESLARSHSGPSSLVATVGKILVEPNAGNVIAGRASVSLDIRSDRDAIRQAAQEELLRKAESVATKRGVVCASRMLLEQPAVSMDEQFTAILAESVEAAGYPPRQMPSGAGHDAMVMATRLPTAMLFLRSPGGISHHPAESVREQDVAAALHAATIFLRRIAQILHA